VINLGSYVIETITLKKQFGGQFAVNDVSIHVEHGKIYGLLGRNGAGKTTTMRMIMGLVRPTSGEIRIFGQNCIKNEKSTYRRIGSIIEAPGFYENLTGSENLRIFARLRGMHRKDAVEQALVSVGLDKAEKAIRELFPGDEAALRNCSCHYA
jgi:bacitracin transport system ATP-binding protein